MHTTWGARAVRARRYEGVGTNRCLPRLSRSVRLGKHAYRRRLRTTPRPAAAVGGSPRTCPSWRARPGRGRPPARRSRSSAASGAGPPADGPHASTAPSPAGRRFTHQPGQVPAGLGPPPQKQDGHDGRRQATERAGKGPRADGGAIAAAPAPAGLDGTGAPPRPGAGAPTATARPAPARRPPRPPARRAQVPQPVTCPSNRCRRGRDRASITNSAISSAVGVGAAASSERSGSSGPPPRRARCGAACGPRTRSA